jgi:hypothetical protein
MLGQSERNNGCVEAAVCHRLSCDGRHPGDACLSSGTRKLARCWHIISMRLSYRPMPSSVNWKAIFRAFKGGFVGWGKLERTANVPVRA